MATITFPSPDQSPFTAPNGVVYVWVTPGNFWMASGDNLTDVYLSKTEDDIAAGAITFESQTTHEDGVRVTGGQIRSNEGGILSFLTSGTANVNVAPGVATLTSYTGYSSGGNASATIDGTLKGYEALGTLQGTPGTRTGTYGFYSAVTAETNAYNFYAAGSASNYLAGGVQFDTAAGTSVLSKYETGQWTPKFGQSGGDDAVIVYDVQEGRYSRIGNLVNAFFYVKVTSVTSTPGNTITLAVKGLPFAGNNFAGNSGTTARSGVTITWQTGWNMEGTNSPAIYSGRVLTSTAFALSYVDSSTGSSVNCKHRQLNDGCLLVGSVTYQATT